MPPMRGTSVEVTRPMDFIPPMMTAPMIVARMRPNTSDPVVEDNQPVPSGSRTVTAWE